MAVARFGQLPLHLDLCEPIGVYGEIDFRIEPMPGMADGDGIGHALAVVTFPLFKVGGTGRRGAEAVPDLALTRKAGCLPRVPMARYRLALGHNLPRLTREEPTATERLQERRDAMLYAGRFLADDEEVFPVALKEEPLLAVPIRVLEG